RLRTTTFFGGFELGPDGLQVGHHLSAVQWRKGRRELLLAAAGAQPPRGRGDPRRGAAQPRP
ncbi:MAG: ABC transporter substrate-binding protein, partial [Gaiellaceae bacterium]